MGTPIRVLIVEDSEDDTLLLVRELRRGGYDPCFERVDRPDAMRDALQDRRWDVVLTDHNMPSFDSGDALSLLQESRLDIPFVIVSGSIGEDYAVAAMKAGAHDYIMKDNLARLVPAVQRELREAESRRARREAEATIRHMAYHDALTDLVNRREFEHRLEQALTSAWERNVTHALLYLDLDQFKLINDTCGHVAGDDLLRQLAVVLQNLVRENDTLARLGGDEFGVLLESCPLERAHRIAEHIRQAVGDFRFVWRDRPFGIGVSIGLVPITAASRNGNDILSAADIACYAAKDQGRNRVHAYDSGDEELARRHGDMKWVSRIKQALENNYFELHRQAIIPLAPQADDATGFEFLLRLRDKDGGLKPAGDFIPAAEHYDLMPAMDRWVVQAAFSYLARLHGGNTIPRQVGTCFINLSGNSLSDSSFFKFIREQLTRHRLPPENICFEITETAAISRLGEAVEFIREIKEQGCRFALDDFGSGLSSFSYLKTIPVDFLKIDGSFVRNLCAVPIDCAIIEAINRIAHVAGIKTIAEFVETDDIRRELQRIGVDYAQGSGIEEPRPLD